MNTTRSRRMLRWLAVAPALLGLAGCVRRGGSVASAPARFSLEVRQILDHRENSPEFYRGRMRLEQMGPEVDAALVSLARAADARLVVRANALNLLAERRSYAAIPVLREVLISEPDEDVRAAAVLAAQRLEGVPEAENLIRSAISDPAPAVRLNAMQALEVRDVGLLRDLLARETDPDLRAVATQLIAIAETRGAPLAPDRRGAFRTAGAPGDPQIVFRPTVVDSLADIAVGDLRVEVPNGTDLALSPRAEVVGGVVPAFFSPDRSAVVYEADREIRVVNLVSRHIREVGAGVAPRPVPFTNQFVFLRPLPGETPTNLGIELRYEVYRAAFAGGEPERVGELTAGTRMNRHANYSPVRWMVVVETPEGFALHGEGIGTFLLPAALWQPAPDAGGRERSGRDGGR